MITKSFRGRLPRPTRTPPQIKREAARLRLSMEQPGAAPMILLFAAIASALPEYAKPVASVERAAELASTGRRSRFVGRSAKGEDMEHRRRQDIPTYHAPGPERLERLAGFLDGLPADALTFCCWYSRGKGCAVGLAAAMNPWFRAQGLRLESAESVKDCRPAYRDHSDWQAVAAFFALTNEDAQALFDRGGYGGQARPHPRQVAQKIRAHLRASERHAIPA